MAYTHNGGWPEDYKHNNNNDDTYMVALLLLGCRMVKIYRTCVAVRVCVLFLVLETGFTLRTLRACACAGPP